MDHSAPPSSDADRALALGQAQATLFATPLPTRLALASLQLPTDPAAAPAKRIQVWRNHAFEPLVEPMQPYLRFGRWQAAFALSDYDDSLMFAGLDAEADLHLLWLDNERLLARMPAEAWLDWLLQRLAALRAQTRAPLLLAGWTPDAALAGRLRERIAALPGVEFADLRALCEAEGVALLDPRNASFAGSPLSRQAQIAVARALACRWLPALLLPPVKALALDLDHTLYAGVLGEDGAAGLALGEAHRALQQQVLALRDKGIFLALVSRNERPDVEALFAARPDFPLQWQHFSATEIGWGDKASALARIADTLRIGLDAIAYVDDNPGELAQVAARHPQLRTVWAEPDAARTGAALRHFPGLWRWRYSAEDGKRLADAAAHAERAALQQQQQDPADYFRSLQVTLNFRVQPAEQLARLADLCVKTNQFNLALRRFNGAELQQRLDDPAAAIVSIALADRLSDSGIVGVLVAEREDTTLRVRELCISCRALGRQLEDSIVAIALQQALARLPACERVVFDRAEGPRNQPALAWLARWGDTDARAFQAPEGVTLRLDP